MGSREKPPDRHRDDDANEREMAWGKGLRASYNRVTQEPLPDRFNELLERLEDAELRHR